MPVGNLDIIGVGCQIVPKVFDKLQLFGWCKVKHRAWCVSHFESPNAPREP